METAVTTASVSPAQPAQPAQKHSFWNNLGHLVASIFSWAAKEAPKIEKDVVTVEQVAQAIASEYSTKLPGTIQKYSDAANAVLGSAVQAILSGTAAVEAGGVNIQLDVIAYEKALEAAKDIKAVISGSDIPVKSPASVS